ncbi:MAG: S1C family serine protease [Elainellaceae cyanobacterium]
MTFQFVQKTRKTSLKLAASGLVALQAAVLGTIVGEVISTQPQLPNARVAFAQDNKVQEVESATVYVETDRGSGSGVVVDPNGLVVTNAHVLEGASEVSVKIQGRQYQARVVSMGDSRCLDLALLQIEGAQNLAIAPLGDAESVYKTQAIYAIGFPLGNSISSDSATITRGIISNIHPDIGRIQLDSPISPGNSGGPIVDSDGNLIGIATSGARGANDINSAISVDKVTTFINAYRHGVSIPPVIMPGSAPDGDALSKALPVNGDAVQGVLQTGDSRLCLNSGLSDLYTFEAEAGQNIMLELSQMDMGGHVFLVGPDGELVAQATTESREQSSFILEKLAQTGTYTVVTSAADANYSGRYQLRATRPILVEAGLVHSSVAPCFDEGQRCLTYKFQGSAQQAITLMLQSEFAPYIMLISPDGEVVDSGRTDKSMAVNFTLSEEGWYTLVVGTQTPEDGGNFFVAIHDTQTLAEPAVEISQR